MIDFEIQRCTRKCCSTERDLRPGETYYSVLLPEGGKVVRHDYSAEGWQGPPEGAIGWWKSVYVDAAANRLHWAPNDVMLNYFEQLEANPNGVDARYVLALLLVRRRVMRVERTATDEAGQEALVLFCPRNEVEYRVKVTMPTAERIAAIQDDLAQLLQTGSAASAG